MFNLGDLINLRGALLLEMDEFWKHPFYLCCFSGFD